MARPSSFSKDVADAICLRLSQGESLRSICRDDAMPSQAGVFLWLQHFPEFVEQYTRAREQQADVLAEQCVDIADEPPVLNVRRGEETEAVEVSIDGGFVAHQRLRIDARKWFASKVAPKKYGDRVDMNHSGSGLNITINGERS